MDLKNDIRKDSKKNGQIISDDELYKNVERDENGNIVRRKVIGSSELMH